LFSLGIGTFFSFFHIVGNEDVVIAVLIIYVTWGNIKGSKSLTNFGLILWRPTASDLTWRMLARTSLWFIHIKLKLVSQRGWEFRCGSHVASGTSFVFPKNFCLDSDCCLHFPIPNRFSLFHLFFELTQLLNCICSLFADFIFFLLLP